MSQFQRGDLVRLKLSDDVFEVVEALPGGKLKLAHPGLQLITSADIVEFVQVQLDEMQDDPPNADNSLFAR